MTVDGREEAEPESKEGTQGYHSGRASRVVCWLDREGVDPYRKKEYTYVKHQKRDELSQMQREGRIKHPSSSMYPYC